MNPIFSSLPTTVFDIMSGLARKHGAINLGQGFPDSPGPEDVRAKAADAVLNGYNQYPPMSGLPELKQALSAHYRRFQGLEIDPDTQVVVTSGATEAITSTLLGLVAPGDEVVMFQPLYDSYEPMVRLAGGVPRLVRLQPPEWRITAEALDGVFSARTRVVVLNNPLNPGAVAYDREQLALLADYCVRFDAIAVCDEVWEHLVFAPAKHTPLMALPGMADRTVKIGSAGKIFSLTGWKVGWAIASPRLTAAVVKAHQYLTFTTAPNLQAAVAYGLGKDDSYFDGMRAEFMRSRDRLETGLRSVGFTTLPSQGTYFLSIDLAASGIHTDDRTFCLRAVEEAGVAAIPVSAFYLEDPVTSIVRVCFAKRDETLDAGIERLSAARRLFN